MTNETKITLDLTRKDVCDLLLACLAAKELSNGSGEKWSNLHAVIKNQLTESDKNI